MADTLKKSAEGTLCAACSVPNLDAKHLVTPTVVVPVLPTAADVDYTILLWVPDTAVIIDTIKYVPAVAEDADSDTDYITLGFAKSAIDAYSATSIATALDTKLTGGTAHVAGTAISFTVTTAASANYIAAGTGVYLVFTQNGTGPAWGGTVVIGYRLQG